MDKVTTLRTFLTLLVICISSRGVYGQGSRQPQCEQGSCYPATGDLLIGRERNLTASSTCGLTRPDRYCVVSYLEKDTKCFTCDSRRSYRAGFNENSHRIENIVSSFKDDAKQRWWQAETGKKQVSIQLDLETEFHFTHMIMTFKTFRPKAMLIERSFDFGRTWKVYRYFAQNCARSFPQARLRVVNNLSDVICDESYSAETPSTSGEVIFRVLPPSVPIPDPYSEDVQDLLKLTNLRINFTELHTLGDTLLDSRPEIKEKYYYSLYDVTVRGSCSCYGHASRCLPVEGYSRDEATSKNMVHGKCECTHNTKGLNCEMCEDFYQDHPWRPARSNQPNICKRCNCNNHATKCHFDASRFKASGEVSGGVCDNCMHNTEGVNCQDCKENFYQDPLRDIRDPQICQPCDCDPNGSLDSGLCEKITDEIAGTVAGRCNCKPFVEGERCDRCKANYWNLNKDNPLGCEPCTCNPEGTLANFGCDQETGLCRCKRYVTNENCDACVTGYYGLSADNPYGCKDCDCDIGGAVRTDCDDVTGQCECRAHISGRHCRKVEPGYFFAHLDFYLFEAEYGRGFKNARVYVRQPPENGFTYWTGPGYMKVIEGDSIEISVSDLPFDTYYDIIIRYDPRIPDVFEDVRVTVIRPEQVNPDGLCGDFSPRDDIKSTSLSPGAHWQAVQPASCLEKGTTYTVRIDFQAYSPGSKNTQATLLIDSILLVPSIDYIPIYQGPGMPEIMKTDFLYYRCDTSQFPSIQSELSEICKKQTFSISAVLHDGALSCECDRTGSTSVECNPSGGQCPCKPNVVGRRCDQCAPGTFGFGPEGCSPCNCHNVGSRDNFCNEQTGQCTCIQNVAGRICDQCRFGFWGFPQCRQCQCNGNAETCDSLTGECLRCNNHTMGDYCERCEDGYYGDPRIGVRIPCKPCMCPGGPNSPVQHADTCNFDPRSQEVYCKCRPGYSGRNCDSCIDNYFGSPTLPGGKCEPCVCNGNINTDDPGSCDASTGECLKCLYNTEGFACEHCSPGYFGDATTQSCQRCVCNSLGTSPDEECDRETGQCRCLPNVVGLRCDQCAANHWNITSNEGCTYCDCDPTGSESLQCNQLDGKCTCIPGRGGDKCADCEDLFYGDPLDQCLPCDCNMQGSTGRQCDRRTGQCECVNGVTGYKCDRCARGTTGDLPNCVPCGECFDNWDKIIMELRGQTQDLVRRANDVSVTGAIKAFDEEFRQMQSSIDEIKKILSGVNLTQVDIKDITNKIDRINNDLRDQTMHMTEVEDSLRNSSTRVRTGDLQVGRLRDNVVELKRLAAELRANATNIQISEAGGAYNKVLEAERQSQTAQNKVMGTVNQLTQSMAIRNTTEWLVRTREQNFREKLNQSSEALAALEKDVEKLDEDLSDINGLVCGEPGSPCSDLCGGGGCGQCGGPSCNGAVTLAQSALSLAQEAENQLNMKMINATKQLEPQIEAARQEAVEAHDQSQMAYEEASRVHNQTQATKADITGLMDSIRKFMIGNDTNTPENVQTVVDEVLAMEIPLSAEEIKDMAEKIKTALASLTNIDEILSETEEKRKIAEQLKTQAKDASDDAHNIRETAQNVRDDLNDTKKVQERAEQAIEKARQDIQDASDDLMKISNITDAVKARSMKSETILSELKQRLEDLNKRYLALKLNTLDKAERTAQEADDWAAQAYEKAKELNATYAVTSENLNDRHSNTKKATELSKKLKDRADNIFRQTESQLQELKDIESKLSGDERRLDKLSGEIEKLNMEMDGYLSVIRKKAKLFETC